MIATPNGFYALSRTKVSWADEKKEWAKPQTACGGGNPICVDFRRENGILIHIAECR